MTQEEIISELQSLVRQSNDAVLLNQTVYDTFKPLFDEAFDDGKYHDGTTHERVMELYQNVFPMQTQAKRMAKEAKLFQEVIDLIEDMNNHIIEMKYSILYSST